MPLSERSAAADRINAVTLLAGVGVLLLAMGVGVLIGRSGSGKAPTAGPAEVVTVAAAGAPTATAPSAGSAAAPSSFSDSWPAAKNGYTVQLQTLQLAGTGTSEVLASESAASTKGAKGVGALRSDDYKGLPSGLYIVYSNVYSSKSQATHALAGLRKSFPAAQVIHVSPLSATGASTGSGSSAAGASTGKGSTGTSGTSTTNTPSSSSGSGQSNEQKSRNMPDVVSTG